MSMIRMIAKKHAVTAAAISLLALFAGPAAAQEPPDDASSYGAIAYKVNGSRYSYGYSWNYSSMSGANRRAIEECGGSCPVVMRFWGVFCGSLARGDNGAWGTASATTQGEANNTARQTCRNYGGTNCSVLVEVCNTQ